MYRLLCCLPSWATSRHSQCLPIVGTKLKRWYSLAYLTHVYIRSGCLLVTIREHTSSMIMKWVFAQCWDQWPLNTTKCLDKDSYNSLMPIYSNQKYTNYYCVGTDRSKTTRKLTEADKTLLSWYDKLYSRNSGEHSKIIDLVLNMLVST